MKLPKSFRERGIKGLERKVKILKKKIEEIEQVIEKKRAEGLKEVDKLVYVRGANRKKIGVIIIHNGRCGWSLCNDLDKWDEYEGISRAYERACLGISIERRVEEVKASIDNWCQYNRRHHFKMEQLYKCLFYQKEYPYDPNYIRFLSKKHSKG